MYSAVLATMEKIFLIVFHSKKKNRMDYESIINGDYLLSDICFTPTDNTVGLWVRSKIICNAVMPRYTLNVPFRHCLRVQCMQN